MLVRPIFNLFEQQYPHKAEFDWSPRLRIVGEAKFWDLSELPQRVQGGRKEQGGAMGRGWCTGVLGGQSAPEEQAPVWPPALALPGSREQGAVSREQGAGRREKGAGSREQGAGNREQEAGSREQGAGSG